MQEQELLLEIGFVDSTVEGTCLAVDREVGFERILPTGWADKIRLGFDRRRIEQGRHFEPVVVPERPVEQ